MNQPPNASQPRQITHVIVSVDAYQAVINCIQDMPYKVAAPVLQTLQQGTRPQPPQGSIVDDKEEEASE